LRSAGATAQRTHVTIAPRLQRVAAVLCRTGTGWQRTPWYAVQRAAWEALKKTETNQLCPRLPLTPLAPQLNLDETQHTGGACWWRSCRSARLLLAIPRRGEDAV